MSARALPFSRVCHQEVVDLGGYLDACNAPATATRTDPEDGHQYPVCHMHHPPIPRRSNIMTTYTADDFKRAEFARHQDLGYLAMRVPRKGHGAWINSKGGELSDHGMAVRDWIPVPAGSYTRTDEQPRSLTADAIESVLHDILPLTANRLGEDDIANIAFDLHAALTEPQRPEGAEEIEAILAELPDTDLPITDAGRADLLAERGVRVTGAES